MPRTGRPKIEIDWEELKKLCEIQCSAEEIAFWFRCSVDTIERKVRQKYNTTFAEYKAQNEARGRVALRRALMQLALKGNLGAIIWAMKNYMGMSDKIDQKIDAIEVSSVTYKSEWQAIDVDGTDSSAVQTPSRPDPIS